MNALRTLLSTGALAMALTVAACGRDSGAAPGPSSRKPASGGPALAQGCVVRVPNEQVDHLPQMEAAPRCEPGGWCWEATRPLGTAAHAVWGSGADDVWFGGWGVIGHWDGKRWAPLDAGVGSRQDVIDIDGTATDDVWFVVTEALQLPKLLHWDGASFRSFSVSPLGISARRRGEVWLLYTGGLVRGDGSTWQQVELPHAPRLDATGQPTTRYAELIRGHGEELWLRGSEVADGVPRPVVLHWDGTAFHDLSAGAEFGQLYPTGPGTAWITSPSGRFQRRSGGAWRTVSIAGGGDEIGPVTRPPQQVSSSGPDDVWVVGSASRPLLRLDGEQLVEFTLEDWNGGRITDVYGVHVRGPGDVFVFTGYLTIHVTAAGCTALYGQGLQSWRVGADLWASARGGASDPLVRWDGSRWSGLGHWVDSQSFTCSEREAWGYGIGAQYGEWRILFRYDSVQTTLGYVSGADVLHYDGGAWSVAASLEPANWQAIWGPDASSLWVAATLPTHRLLRLQDGSLRPPTPCPGSPQIGARAIWGRSADDVWVVGNGLGHWNGACLSVEQSAAGDAARMCGNAAGDLRAELSDGSALVRKAATP